MNGFKLASRSLTRKGRGNIIKITSLGLGLAVGLVLLAKVFFEYNYESFWPDAGRIYRVALTYLEGSEENPTEDDDYTTSGAPAYQMGLEIPQIEAATRFRYMAGNNKILNSGREAIGTTTILADSCLYDVLPRPMVQGDAKRILSTPMSAMVSRSLAEKLGGNVIGQIVEFDEYPGRGVTIEGIFEDVPENSLIRYDMAISLGSITAFFGWDGSMQWQGNDIYYSFFKLRPGVSPDEMIAPMRAVQERHDEMDYLAEAGYDIRYWIRPVSDFNTGSSGMLLLAISMIAIALLNYLIITLSTVIGRAREIAVCKCYGACGGDIRKQVLAEATLHIALSLVAAAVIVGVFQTQVQEVLQTSLIALFSWQGIVIVAGVCVVLIVIATWVPGRLFVNVPAASVFRNFRRNRKTWKLTLLFVQFAGAVVFVAVLFVMWRQYDMMMSFDLGYDHKSLVYANVSGTEQSERQVVIDNLRAMPQVEVVATSAAMPNWGMGGNSVSLSGSEHVEFDASDLYGADENYLDLLGVPLIEGEKFKRGASTPTTTIMVSRSFARRLSMIDGWGDGVVGKTINMSYRGESTIVGVYEDFRIGTAKNYDSRPSVMDYSEELQNNIWVRLRDVNGETMREVQQVIQKAMPDKIIEVNAMKNTIAGLYEDERIERNSIVLCSLITLLIVLLGLVGYLTSEITRRSAEIAIRKINGAGTGDVLLLLVREIAWVALPALATGSLVAYYISRQWVSGFATQITLTPWLYIVSSAAVLAVILAVAVAVSYRISVQNPVDSLKKDE